MELLFSIEDNINEKSGDAVLCMAIGDHHFSFAIAAKDSPGPQALGYYKAQLMDPETLNSIFTSQPALKQTFSTVQVSFDYLKNLLLPEGHPSVHSAPSLFEVIHGKDGQYTIVAEGITERQLQNVYAVPTGVNDWLHRRFPAADTRHHFTLEMKTMPPGGRERLLVNVHTDQFSFIALKDDRLLIAQTHIYESPEDISYCLLKTCHQFSLSQETVEILLTGLVEKESQLFREIYQFFVNVDFRHPAWQFPEDCAYPSYYFTPLNDLARCAS